MVPNVSVAFGAFGIGTNGIGQRREHLVLVPMVSVTEGSIWYWYQWYRSQERAFGMVPNGQKAIWYWYQWYKRYGNALPMKTVCLSQITYIDTQYTTVT